jgi:hypothetical protein
MNVQGALKDRSGAAMFLLRELLGSIIQEILELKTVATNMVLEFGTLAVLKFAKFLHVDESLRGFLYMVLSAYSLAEELFGSDLDCAGALNLTVRGLGVSAILSRSLVRQVR